MNESTVTDVAQQLLRRRSAAATAWNLTDQIVLVAAGDPIPVPGRGDLTYPFRAHSEYYYLTDRNQPGGVLVFDPQEGWLDFVSHPTAEEQLWLGPSDDEPAGLATTELPPWLSSRTERPVACLGVRRDGVTCDHSLSNELRGELDRIRRPKDALELERMRLAERATSAAFGVVARLVGDGATERGLEIELEAEAFRGGDGAMAYDTIIASGKWSAVLHHLPTTRRMRDGELVLIDAGADYLGYASDITRTYSVGRRFNAEQEELHGVVHAAQLAAIERCSAGTEWRDVHLTAARAIAEGLVSCGILRGHPDSLVESGAVWLFFPHGIGHLVGLGVRDAGGALLEQHDQPPPFPHLRIDLPLEPGMVVTVEPGIYLVPALLQDPDRRSHHRVEVAWNRVDSMLDFGGIRIEDDVLITGSGHEVLTRDVDLRS